MPIIFHNDTKVFHLYNSKLSYVIQVNDDQDVEQLYFGHKISDLSNFSELTSAEIHGNQVSSHTNLLDSKENHLREYPDFGTGDMRTPAFSMTKATGSQVTHLRFSDYKIIPGKPRLASLPATYVEHENECTTLIISLTDNSIHLRVLLYYSIFEDQSVITRSVKFNYDGCGDLLLNGAMSLSLDLPGQEFVMTSLIGGWARERHIEQHEIHAGVQSIGSNRGHSSAQYNPFFSLSRKNTTQHSGNVIGCSLIYSGNFVARVEADPYQHTRLQIGISPSQFQCNLRQERTFQTPEAIIVFSENGFNGMSQTFHQLFNENLVRGPWKNKVRPILVNNWEATYFSFDENKILKIADVAKEIGIELFVLDDGWFGNRNDDTSSLGDWFSNTDKLPLGISHLSQQIRKKGLKFGIWIEPEMISKNSHLYNAHPDWVLGDKSGPISMGRNQYVLDFSNKAVIDNLYNQISKVLQSTKADYVKWDMNRSLTEVFSNVSSPSQQGMVSHKYMLGVYSLFDRLLKEFPTVLFESCASGGGRFDPGMLYYAPQTWASDDTDAIERISIQYGTSFVYPLSSIGAHISAVPNEQLLRTTPLATRFNVAMFGSFGYELNLTDLTKNEIETLKSQVKFIKENRRLLQFGRFYRLSEPNDLHPSWMCIDQSKDSAIVADFTRLQEPDAMNRFLKLSGLDPNSNYICNDSTIYSGSQLLFIGLPINDKSRGDFSSNLFTLKKIK